MSIGRCAPCNAILRHQTGVNAPIKFLRTHKCVLGKLISTENSFLLNETLDASSLSQVAACVLDLQDHSLVLRYCCQDRLWTIHCSNSGI